MSLTLPTACFTPVETRSLTLPHSHLTHLSIPLDLEQPHLSYDTGKNMNIKLSKPHTVQYCSDGLVMNNLKLLQISPRALTQFSDSFLRPNTITAHLASYF